MATFTSMQKDVGEVLSSVDCNDVAIEQSYYDDFFNPWTLPNLSTFSEVATMLNLSDTIDSSCDQKNLPARKPKPIPKYTLTKTDNDADNEKIDINKQLKPLYENEYTSEIPFHATINNAKFLTKSSISADVIKERKEKSNWGTARHVVHMDIDLNGSGITYIPGDSIGIVPPNPIEHVMNVLNRCQEVVEFEAQAQAQAASSSSSDALASGEIDKQATISKINLDTIITINNNEKEKCSINELLTFRLDISKTFMKKINIYALSKYCKSINERNQMEWLCSKDSKGKLLYDIFIEKQNLTFSEFLFLFPSCHPSIGAIMAYTSPTKPRYYSAASSPLKDGNVKANILSIAFSIVQYNCCITDSEAVIAAATNNTADIDTDTNAKDQTSASVTTKKIIYRAGLCTSYLEKAAKKWLYPLLSSSSSPSSPSSPLSYFNSGSDEDLNNSSNNSNNKIRIFHKASNGFHLPGSVAHPLILIGPGTGVSPFIGFLQHREELEKRRLGYGYSHNHHNHSSSSCSENGANNSSNKRSTSYDHLQASTECSEGLWRGGYEIDHSSIVDHQGEENNTAISNFIHDTLPGTIDLYFGCRNHNDYLYSTELNNHRETKTLTNLYVAMSRLNLNSNSNSNSKESISKCKSEIEIEFEEKETSSTATTTTTTTTTTDKVDTDTTTAKVYVTNYIKKNAETIIHNILHNGAYVYVCGDGNNMAKDVNQVLLDSLILYGNMSNNDALEFIQTLKAKRRYCLDIWS